MSYSDAFSRSGGFEHLLDRAFESFPLRERIPLDGISLLVALCISLAVIVTVGRCFKSSKNRFDRDDGEVLKCISHDTRFTRFTAGAELSANGRKLSGNDPYLIKNGKKTELVIFTPDHVSDFLAGDLPQHTKPANMHLGDYAGRLFGQCIGVQNGSKWKAMRAQFDPHYAMQSVAKATADLDLEIKDWIAHDLGGTTKTKESYAAIGNVDILGLSKLLSFRLIARNLYGEVYDGELFRQLQDIYQLHSQVVLTGVLNPRTLSAGYNILPTKTKRQLEEYKARWAQINERVLSAAEIKSIRCPAFEIHKAVDEHKGIMTDEEYLQTLDEILFANVNVTGTVLGFLFTNLARSPQLQDRLLAEAKAAGEDQAYFVRQDTLLHYTTLESLRVSPSVHFSLPELTGADKKIDGFAVPAGTPVIVDIRRLNTDSVLWAPDPETFRPDRFEKMSATSYRHGMLRFGVGTGRCLGRHLADRILKMVTVQVLKSFELKESSIANEEGGKGFTIGHESNIELVKRQL